MRIEPGRVMTDDQLMMAARAAGFSMIPPQDVSENEPETVIVEDKVELSEVAAAYFSRLRAWLPSAATFSGRHSRAPA